METDIKKNVYIDSNTRCLCILCRCNRLGAYCDIVLIFNIMQMYNFAITEYKQILMQAKKSVHKCL